MPGPMTRDMDLIRSLLLEIEGGKRVFYVISHEIAEMMDVDPALATDPEEADRLEYHLGLLQDAKFVELHRGGGGAWQIERITWTGHEFLDTVRDSEVWRRTKEAAKTVGIASISLIWDMAKAYGKHVASERLGIALA